jgi:hypothetical protein
LVAYRTSWCFGRGKFTRFSGTGEDKLLATTYYTMVAMVAKRRRRERIVPEYRPADPRGGLLRFISGTFNIVLPLFGMRFIAVYRL